jgi:hypothetical protein
MIRDRIVVGIKDANLSVKMQLDPDLTLKKATDMARQSESRNPLFCSSSMVTDLTDLLVAQHFAKCPMFEYLKHFTPFAG